MQAFFSKVGVCDVVFGAAGKVFPSREEKNRLINGAFVAFVVGHSRNYNLGRKADFFSS